MVVLIPRKCKGQTPSKITTARDETPTTNQTTPTQTKNNAEQRFIIEGRFRRRGWVDDDAGGGGGDDDGD